MYEKEVWEMLAIRVRGVSPLGVKISCAPRCAAFVSGDAFYGAPVSF